MHQVYLPLLGMNPRAVRFVESNTVLYREGIPQVTSATPELELRVHNLIEHAYITSNHTTS